MTKRKNPESSGALVATTDNVDYMAQYPWQMRHTTDVHLVLTGCTLPVHSFMLMAFSPFFSELVSSYQIEAHKKLVEDPLKIPMQEVTEEALRAALTYLYLELRSRNIKPGVTDIQQAKQLAKIGHKYQVGVLHEAADMFVEKWLRSDGFEELKEFEVKHVFGADQTTAKTQQQALGVINMTGFAEVYNMQRTLQCCTDWLAQHFAQVDDVAHHALYVLTFDTCLKIMRELSTLPAQKVDGKCQLVCIPDDDDYDIFAEFDVDGDIDTSVTAAFRMATQ